MRLSASERFRVVDERYLESEVHECSIRGALLATIEYMMIREPGTLPSTGAASGTTGQADPDPATDEPCMEQAPQACLEDANREHDDRLEVLLSVARDRIAAWQ